MSKPPLPEHTGKSPREQLDPAVRSHVIVHKAKCLPLEDRRKTILLKRAVDEMVTAAEKGNMALRRVSSATVYFDSTVSENVTRLTCKLRIDQYGGTTEHSTIETDDELAITEE